MHTAKAGGKQGVNSNDRNAIVNTLKNGGAVAIYVSGSDSGFSVKYSGDNPLASSRHWLALLDVSANGSEVFIANTNRKIFRWMDEYE